MPNSDKDWRLRRDSSNSTRMLRRRALCQKSNSRQGGAIPSSTKGALEKAMTLARGQATNPDATAPPRVRTTTAQGAPAVTLTPSTEKREENVRGRLSGAEATGGADVVKMMASRLLDITERLGKTNKTGLTARIPEDSPALPLAQRRVEKNRA